MSALEQTPHTKNGTSAEEAIATGQQREQEAKAGDAYARGGADGLTWTIGTKLVEMTFDGSNGGFRLVSFLNKQTDPAVEYVDPKSPAAPFVLNFEGTAKDSTKTEADGKWTLKTGIARQVAARGRPLAPAPYTS